MYEVTISRPGFGRFTGGTFCQVYRFRDESKAHDCYIDMLIRYPKFEVKLDRI